MVQPYQPPYLTNGQTGDLRQYFPRPTQVICDQENLESSSFEKNEKLKKETVLSDSPEGIA